MNTRDKEIFLRGFNVGLRIAEEFETGLPMREERNIKEKKTRGKCVPWTEEEDQLLVESKNLTTKELVALFPNRGYNAVITRKSHLGLKKEKKIDNGLAKLGQ